MRQSFLRFNGHQHDCKFPIASAIYNEMLESVVKEHFGSAEIAIQTALKEQFAPKDDKEIEAIFLGQANGVLAIEIIVQVKGAKTPNFLMAFVGNEELPDEV